MTSLAKALGFLAAVSVAGAGGLALVPNGRASNETGIIGTAGVLCSLMIDQANPSVDLTSRAQWSCGDGKRRLEANGVPNHAIGDFPNAHNPFHVSEQEVWFETTLTPAATGTHRVLHVIGFAFDGVKFDPGTAGTCRSGASDLSQCTPIGNIGPWSLEAMGGSYDFGVDSSHGHVQPGGAYHYHGMPEGLLTKGKAMTLVGWAVDGFPIYARYGLSDPANPHSAIKIMRASYQLKPVADPNRPSTELLPMGSFSQDYEYVARSGDLDECNGRYGATPEFPNGIYHYYVTDTYPFVQRCVKGTSFLPDGPPPSGAPQGAPPLGE
jgi:hypothetical protein